MEEHNIEDKKKQKAKQTLVGAIALIVIVLFISIFFGVFVVSKTDFPQSEAIKEVAALLPKNELGILPSDLKAKDNPKGEGVFVYAEPTHYIGVERQILWLMIDDKVYPLNGATKDITPALDFPRDADETVWSKTGLDKYNAEEAIGLVFN